MNVAEAHLKSEARDGKLTLKVSWWEIRRLIARDRHSLHFGLSAPPTASQASVPGVVIETRAML
jgi:hypothetical protein